MKSFQELAVIAVVAVIFGFACSFDSSIQASPNEPQPSNQTDKIPNAFALFGDTQTAIRRGILSYQITPSPKQGAKHTDEKVRDFLVSLPMTVDKIRNQLFVTVSINNQKVRLLVDTGGGPGIVLDKEVAKPTALSDPFPARLWGIQGYEPVIEGVLHSMKLGSLTLGRIDTVIRQDAAPLEFSTIGTQLLEHYCVILNFENKTLTLSRGTDSRPVPLKQEELSVPFRDVDGFIFVPVHILGKPAWGHLDSGSDTNVLSLNTARTAATQISSQESSLQTKSEKFSTGSSHEGVRFLLLARPVPVSIDTDASSASRAAKYGTTSQVGMSGFEETYQSFSILPDVSLGVPFLLQFRCVIIDYPNHRLVFQGPIHGSPLNPLASPSDPGPAWPNYLWQHNGDGWQEVPAESVLSKPGTSTPNVNSKSTTTVISQPNRGGIVVITNGVKTEYPFYTTVTVDNEGKVHVSPPLDSTNTQQSP